MSQQRTLVMKFGGTSVGSTEAIEQAAEIVKQAHKTWQRLVVVTSAMAGVTNLLLDSAARACAGGYRTLCAYGSPILCPA